MTTNQSKGQPENPCASNALGNHQMEQLRAKSEQLMQTLRAVEAERDQLRRTLATVEAERDDYRKVAYAWAREKFSEKDFEPFDESEGIPIEEVLRQLDEVEAEVNAFTS